MIIDERENGTVKLVSKVSRKEISKFAEKHYSNLFPVIAISHNGKHSVLLSPARS